MHQVAGAWNAVFIHDEQHVIRWNRETGIGRRLHLQLLLILVEPELHVTLAPVPVVRNRAEADQGYRLDGSRVRGKLHVEPLAVGDLVGQVLNDRSGPLMK